MSKIVRFDYAIKYLLKHNYISSVEERTLEKDIKRGELAKSLQIAKKMLIKKRSIEEIHEITELSIEKIKQLKIEIEKS